ncbi:MAG: hypothetical protein LBH01_01095 [Verrucomicrobiales bacterium]|nr:hypothetical protein [Verrucomicrobiales bacterium]
MTFHDCVKKIEVQLKTVPGIGIKLSQPDMSIRRFRFRLAYSTRQEDQITALFGFIDRRKFRFTRKYGRAAHHITECDFVLEERRGGE